MSTAHQESAVERTCVNSKAAQDSAKSVWKGEGGGRAQNTKKEGDHERRRGRGEE